VPATNFPEYVNAINDLISNLVVSTQARLLHLQIDQRSMLRGFIAGGLAFNDDSELHFREFIDLTQAEPRVMYAYDYQDIHKKLIFRYDNAPHKPVLPQPEHKHTPQGVALLSAPTLADVFDEILA
jgi:hypothetical protein